LKTQFTTKKTAEKHYNRNIHISQKGNPVKHWHLQQHQCKFVTGRCVWPTCLKERINHPQYEESQQTKIHYSFTVRLVVINSYWHFLQENRSW